MKRFVFLTVFFLLDLGYTGAQPIYTIEQAIDFFNSNKLHRGDRISGLTETNIEGSPYLNDEFIEGSVFTISKTRFVGVPLRYNIYNDQVEFRSDDGSVLALAAPEVIEKVEFGEYLLEYVPYLNVKKIGRGFFVVLEKGNATLFSRPRILFERAKEPGAYQEAQPAKFVKRPDEYYIRVGMEPAKLVSGVKDLEDAFPVKQKEIVSFIKKNKVRPNRPEALKELVQYYNSL